MKLYTEQRKNGFSYEAKFSILLSKSIMIKVTLFSSV